MTFRLFVSTGLVLLASIANVFAESPTQPYEYMRGDIVVPCPDDENENCIWHRLIIDNQSANTLECRSTLVFDKLTSRDHHMVVEPATRKSIFSDTTTPDVQATSHKVDCKVRPPVNDSKLTPNCKATLTKKPTGTIDYPAESRKAGEEGPVMLEFSFSDKEGPPTDIVVVGSSLWPKLDESAKKYVGQYAGVTDCKKGRFRMPLTFRLRT